MQWNSHVARYVPALRTYTYLHGGGSQKPRLLGDGRFPVCVFFLHVIRSRGNFRSAALGGACVRVVVICETTFPVCGGGPTCVWRVGEVLVDVWEIELEEMGRVIREWFWGYERDVVDYAEGRWWWWGWGRVVCGRGIGGCVS